MSVGGVRPLNRLWPDSWDQKVLAHYPTPPFPECRSSRPDRRAAASIPDRSYPHHHPIVPDIKPAIRCPRAKPPRPGTGSAEGARHGGHHRYILSKHFKARRPSIVILIRRLDVVIQKEPFMSNSNRSCHRADTYGWISHQPPVDLSESRTFILNSSSRFTRARFLLVFLYYYGLCLHMGLTALWGSPTIYTNYRTRAIARARASRRALPTHVHARMG